MSGHIISLVVVCVCVCVPTSCDSLHLAFHVPFKFPPNVHLNFLWCLQKGLFKNYFYFLFYFKCECGFVIWSYLSMYSVTALSILSLTVTHLCHRGWHRELLLFKKKKKRVRSWYGRQEKRTGLSLVSCEDVADGKTVSVRLRVRIHCLFPHTQGGGVERARVNVRCIWRWK